MLISMIYLRILSYLSFSFSQISPLVSPRASPSRIYHIYWTPQLDRESEGASERAYTHRIHLWWSLNQQEMNMIWSEITSFLHDSSNTYLSIVLGAPGCQTEWVPYPRRARSPNFLNHVCTYLLTYGRARVSAYDIVQRNVGKSFFRWGKMQVVYWLRTKRGNAYERSKILDILLIKMLMMVVPT